MLNIKGFVRADGGEHILVSEDFMEAILEQEGFNNYDCDDIEVALIDSGRVVELAYNHGFSNLGDYGDGFIFHTTQSDLELYGKNLLKYFK